MKSKFLSLLLFQSLLFSAAAQTNEPFDGIPWHISTGNLSVSYIQASPVGAFPRANYFEAPPSVESMADLKRQGLVANEDYVAWGALERAPGEWIWKQHDDMEHALHQAGLRYVVYGWSHFPPVWLRNQPDQRTLLRCLEHGEEANYLSIFDPRTIQWYDHVYRALHEHFGNRIDDIYAFLLGPYGEGNYPLLVKDWVNMGHCHEGYWCGDAYALQEFEIAMKRKYHDIASLNQAWGVALPSFDEVRPPKEISAAGFRPQPSAFPKPQDKRRWLDFITWYHQAIVDFAGQSVQAALKYFPPEHIRMKPGGNAVGMNPIAWGTYCPAYAKMAQPYRIVLQPADCQGAIFGDKWMGTAYQFYHVTESTEPAGDLDEKAFLRRMFSDASCGASQFFSYQFPQHAADMRKYVHLFTGQPGETEVAVYAPTTLYRLGGDYSPSVRDANEMRDLCDFDVLDELLINDGALTTNRYRALVMFQSDLIDRPVLEKIDAFLRAGGKVIVTRKSTTKDVENRAWEPVSLTEVPAWNKHNVSEIAAQLAGLKGVDGVMDGVWACRRGKQIFLYNTGGKPAHPVVDGKTVEVGPYSIWEN